MSSRFDLSVLLLCFWAFVGGASSVAAQEALSYVGSDACTDCHEDAVAAWEGSHHALAWTTPGEEAVIADFDGTEFAHDGTLTRFRVEDGQYFATVTEKDGVTTDYPLHSVVGIAPLQQYLFETEPGRLQSFDVVWDAGAERWYHLYPDQDLPPDDGLHWTGPYKNWNARCAECHATGFEKNYDRENGIYASTQAEIGVGCEACHGPGSGHLDWAAGLKVVNGSGRLSEFGLPTEFASSNPEATIQQCATCHSRREAHGEGNPLPGTEYHDSYNLALLRPAQYHADGQILDEVYVYGSFLQSKMYARGVSCSNCHDPHTAQLVAEETAVCTQCHSPAGNPDFPTLTPKEYDSAEHHFHEPDSDGAQCKSCHMVERTYMGIDGRRDHSFRIPRPDLGPETASPDACTDCHSDQTASWAATAIAEWYPDSPNRGPHFGQTLARGRRDPMAGHTGFVDLAMDAEVAGIVRATALWMLEASADAGAAERLAPLLEDPDPLIRANAVAIQRAAPPQDSISRIVPMLSDPVLSVRIAAAKAMLALPIARLPSRVRQEFSAALGEWQQSLSNRLDFPETHLVLGGMALTMRNMQAASSAFREVTKLDPQRVDAWVMLVRIAAATDGAEAATNVLEDALLLNSEDPTLQEIARELEAAQ